MNQAQLNSESLVEHHELKKAFSILVVDDEPGIQDFLCRSLSKTYTLVMTAGSAEEADDLIKNYHFDLLIVDLCLPGISGLDWLEKIVKQGYQSDIITITAFADMDKAISALRIGAADFIFKPFHLEQITSSVQRCVERHELLRENFVLRQQIDKVNNSGLIGSSDEIKSVHQIISRVAPTPSVVLIEGESGTGKELAAKAIHQESGRSGQFVAVNCAAIVPELLESELFGHIKGAFSGAQQSRQGMFSYAENGTIFLDEIAEMPLAMQAKLLRVLEDHYIRPVGTEQEVLINVRVVAASNKNLEKQVQEGLFRADLYFRLNVLTLSLPSLRERKQDIPILVQHFSNSLSKQLSLPCIPFTHADIQQLQAYNWPGNVRELKNLIERCLLLGRLPYEILSSLDSKEDKRGYPDSWTLDNVEKEHILKALRSVDGNNTKAAENLGISRKTLWRKLQAWSLIDSDD